MSSTSEDLDKMFSVMNDTTLFHLPHFQRMNIGNVLAIMRETLSDIWEELLADLSDHNTSNGFIIDKYCKISETFNLYTQSSAEMPGSVNHGTADLLLVYIRYLQTGQHSFQTRNELEEALENSDIGEKSPCNFLRLPYPLIYIEFGEDRSQHHYIHNDASGKHIVEGCYIHEHISTPSKSFRLDHFTKVMEIDSNKLYRNLEFTITGSPIGKSNLQDDASRQFKLIITDEDAPLQTLLDKQIDYWMKYPSTILGSPNMSEQEASDTKNGIYHAAKVLLYINSESYTSTPAHELTELKASIERKGKKKQAKLLNKVNKTYDRVLIGSKTHDAHDDASIPRNINGGHVKTHWRRGHFRQQAYGKELAERKLIWIKPTLVSAENMDTSEVKSKPYKIA